MSQPDDRELYLQLKESLTPLVDEIWGDAQWWLVPDADHFMLWQNGLDKVRAITIDRDWATGLLATPDELIRRLRSALRHTPWNPGKVFDPAVGEAIDV